MGRTISIISRFPDFYDTKEFDNVFHRFIDVFGRTLDGVENDLIKVMRSHWVDTADNEDSRGFDTAQKGDLDKIFSLYLENLGGTSQLKQTNRRSDPNGAKEDDDIYRKRINGLINVLKSGASSQEGIITIVAANLGIVGDDDAAVGARKQIRIVEFLPEPFKTDLYEVTLHEKFLMQNPNVIDTTPEIRLRMRSDLHVPLVNPRLVNLTTGKFVKYEGVVKGDDVLSFFSDGTAFLNGVLIPLEGKTPALPPGQSIWRFEASFGLAEAVFDRTLFDFSTFERERLNQVAVFDEGGGFDRTVFAFALPVANLGMTLSRLTPASFMVRIPWDIPEFTVNFKITEQSLQNLRSNHVPEEVLTKLENIKDQEIGTKEEFLKALNTELGEEKAREYETLILRYVEFTDKFARLSVNPRNQIKYIVNKVKAAGVFVVIAYEKRFAEAHDLADFLTVQLPLREEHVAEEANFDIGSMQIPYPGGLEHGLADALVTSGVFDYTRFDSLNTFA